MVEETAQTFRVDPRIYDDPNVFDAEMARIFESNWVYVGHESEIAEPGSYFTSTMGTQPIIVCRGSDDNVRVFLNVCRHRGNILCREETGKSKAFSCRYHGWAFTNDGALLSVPDIEAYPASFQREKEWLGLLQARVSTHRGLIFANLKPEGESLDEHLGAVKTFIDLWADMAPAGMLRISNPHSYHYPANWKFQVENGVDMYHPSFVHQSAFSTFRRQGIQKYQQRRALVRESITFGFDHGHSVLERPGLESIYTPEQFNAYLDALAKRHGRERAERIATIRHVHIFPNICLMDGNIRVIQPLAVTATNVHSYFTTFEGVGEDINTARLRDYQRRLGTTGLVGTDDIDIFAGSQSGIRARGLERLIFDRGIDREVMHPGGMRQGGPMDETPQRAIYRGWLRAMNGSHGG
jgi:benzoate/toluate 1,2-dioxygenase subunit alpha